MEGGSGERVIAALCGDGGRRVREAGQHAATTSLHDPHPFVITPSGMHAAATQVSLHTCAACAVPRVYAPPAIVLWHDPHDQIPTHARLTVSLPQKTHVYLECWLISIFLTTFRSDEPYRLPYLPVMPAFLVRCSQIARTSTEESEKNEGCRRHEGSAYLVDHWRKVGAILQARGAKAG